MPVQWFTSSPIFPQSAGGSLWKGGSSVPSSCLICCMLSLLLRQQKIFTGLCKIRSCFMQVSDRVAALTESSLNNIVLRIWSRGRAAISAAPFEPQPLWYHWMSCISHLTCSASTWKITVFFWGSGHRTWILIYILNQRYLNLELGTLKTFIEMFLLCFLLCACPNSFCCVSYVIAGITLWSALSWICTLRREFGSRSALLRSCH